jgi:protein-S-isoprenylcysteine O-methyltransferase Ste14
MGAGPKIGIIVLPWLAGSIFLTLKFRNAFVFSDNAARTLSLIGFGWLIVGIIIYLLTVPVLLKGLKTTKLMKTGTFYLCSNPLYSSIILFILPGISLMMNSWLVLTTSVIAFASFRIFIKCEYEELEKFFGDDYRKYRKVTPEIFPFPYKKWFRSA